MLERKDLIQKSFRIDKKLDEALAELSSILNRSQNELIDVAIRLLLKENQNWFTDGFVNEYYYKIVDELYKPNLFRIKDYEMRFQPYDSSSRKGAYLILNEIKASGDVVETFVSIVDNDPGTHERIKNSLREIAKIIVKKYPELKKRYGISDVDV